MTTIRKIVVGESTESIIRFLFDHRIALESEEVNYNSIDRAMKIRDLKGQVISFIKRNPNSNFELIAPERISDKIINLRFTNYNDDITELDECSEYVIEVDDSFVKAYVTQKVKVGKNITLTIKAE